MEHNFPDLNLPAGKLQIKQAEDGAFLVWDVVRKKNIILTPEEWVRQHMLHFLMDQFQYPKSLIRIEGGLQYNHRQKRSDLLVYNRQGKPWFLLELKSYKENLNEAAFRQAALYNQELRADYLAISNGIKHYCAKIHWPTKAFEMQTYFPAFPQGED